MSEKLKEKEAEAKEKVGASAIAVFLKDKYGNETYVRTYSVADHGENFLDLAQEYQTKITQKGAEGILREDKR